MWHNYLCKTAEIPKWCSSVACRRDAGDAGTPEGAAPGQGFMDAPEMLALPSAKTLTFYSDQHL